MRLSFSEIPVLFNSLVKSSLAALLLAISVWSNPAHADETVMTTVLHQHPRPDSFDMCHSGGCADVSHVSLMPEEWQQVIVTFQPLPQTAEEERMAIAKAIGSMETLVGAKTGTSTDRGGTFGNSAYPGQLDCNDEAINTTNYIKMLADAGLIQFHELIDIHRRGFFLTGWPHSTAAIRDRQTGQRYAVDAWFHDNGHPAEVLTMELWKSGWKPANTNAH